jgi:DeoR family glycerol-3-phosphate regulon repressor
MVIADKAKFARKAPVKIGSLAEVDDFVTDHIPSERLTNTLSDWGTKVHLA